jgi:hypothetical protein
MDLKSMLIEKAVAKAKEMASEQADGVEDMLITYIQSKEVEDKLADMMDKAINIPFVSDQREEPFFQELADGITDIMAGVVRMVKKEVS